jgi:RNA polymerase sigma factor (sigma-70 family)
VSPSPFVRLTGAQSDQRLLASARNGDERAFEVVVRRHRRALLRYCRRMGLSDSRAEDVVQQALLQAWLALQRGREVSSPKAWLYRTVHNTALNVIRASRDDHAPIEEGVHLGPQASVESDFERKLAVRQALSDVAALPHMQREAILLTAFDGRSHEEVASALGVTHGAVRGLLYRARTTLRDAAAALVPQPLLAWAGACLARVAPSATRLAEVSPPGGGSDMGAALAKGVALAGSAALLAVGTGIVPVQHPPAHRPKTAVVALGGVPGGSAAEPRDAATPPASGGALSGANPTDARTGARGPRGGDGHRVAPGSTRGASGPRRAGSDEHGRVHDGRHHGSGDGSGTDGSGILVGDNGVIGAPNTASLVHEGTPSPDASHGDRGTHPKAPDASPPKPAEEAAAPEPEPPSRREADRRSGKGPEPPLEPRD